MADPLRLLLVNENIGGHGTMHRHIAEHLPAHSSVAASWFHVPRAGLVRKVLSAPLPGLGRLDADFHVLRSQLVVSAMVDRELSRRAGSWDVIHVYTHNAALLSAGLLARGPSIVGLDAPSFETAPRLPYRYPTRLTPLVVKPAMALERRVYESATLVVAKSAWARQSLLDNYGLPADKVRIIPYGTTIPATGRPGPPTGRPRITFIGRSLDRKGGRRLLDVWRADLSGLATLSFVTPEKLPPEPGVEVINDVTPTNGRLNEVLAATSVLAFPSDVDAFGYALLEAMAMGVPVVATRNAAAPELVGEGIGGLVVEKNDDRALAEALRLLVTDHQLNAQMGRAARARAVTHYDAAVTTAALVDLVHEAAELFHGRQGVSTSPGWRRHRSPSS